MDKIKSIEEDIEIIEENISDLEDVLADIDDQIAFYGGAGDRAFKAKIAKSYHVTELRKERQSLLKCRSQIRHLKQASERKDLPPKQRTVPADHHEEQVAKMKSAHEKTKREKHAENLAGKVYRELLYEIAPHKIPNADIDALRVKNAALSEKGGDV